MTEINLVGNDEEIKNEDMLNDFDLNYAPINNLPISYFPLNNNLLLNELISINKYREEDITDYIYNESYNYITNTNNIDELLVVLIKKNIILDKYDSVGIGRYVNNKEPLNEGIYKIHKKGDNIKIYKEGKEILSTFFLTYKKEDKKYIKKISTHDNVYIDIISKELKNELKNKLTNLNNYEKPYNYIVIYPLIILIIIIWIFIFLFLLKIVHHYFLSIYIYILIFIIIILLIIGSLWFIFTNNDLL